jgi:signal transduction histidine kinase
MRTDRRLASVLVLGTGAAVGAGLSLALLAGHFNGRPLLPAELAVVIGGVGLLIVWYRPANRIGWLLSVTGALFGLGVLVAGLMSYAGTHSGVPHTLLQAALLVGWMTAALSIPWALLVLWFPDGEFSSDGWRRFFVVGAVICFSLALCGYLFAPGGHVGGAFSGYSFPHSLHGPFARAGGHAFVVIGGLVPLFPLAVLPALIGRYRRSGGIVRRQIEWLLTGAGLAVIGGLVSGAMLSASGSLHAVGLIIALVTQPLPSFAVAVAILRYRLWEIDLVVSRGLLYAVIWAALSVLLLVPALAAGVLIGGSKVFLAVGIALVVTAAFQPARSRLEDAVDRFVYRHRPRGYALLARISTSLRADEAISSSGYRVVELIKDGLGVQWAGVWLYVEVGDGHALRSLGVTGGGPESSMILPPDVGGRVTAMDGLSQDDEVCGDLVQLWPEAPAAMLPIRDKGDLIGLLATGQRPGDPLADRDFEFLEVLCRELALALRNYRLEAELRERLSHIEVQAEELRRSRQRLVSAQDEERRKIERNLHDGVQQRLVALATKIRQAGSAPGDYPVSSLADEAEAAVFELQELARGIFPSLLADQGLASALWTQAARAPMDVRVEVEPRLAGQRFKRDVEAALYFMASEALANAQKHAPDSSVSIQIHMDGAGRNLLLEVHDDGPGFEVSRRKPGTGIQNMTDRVAAVGGQLTVESRPGNGTWLTAQVPIEVEPVILQYPADDSRR